MKIYFFGYFFTLSALFGFPARAADPLITVTGTATVGCELNTSSLDFEFASLVVGQPVTKTGAVVVDCHGASSNVDIAVAWHDGGSTSSGIYTFTDNKDSVLAQFCYTGSSSSCWVSPTYFNSGSFPVDLRLTYTAAVAETTQRLGELRVSYH